MKYNYKARYKKRYRKFVKFMMTGFTLLNISTMPGDIKSHASKKFNTHYSKISLESYSDYVEKLHGSGMYIIPKLHKDRSFKVKTLKQEGYDLLEDIYYNTDK